MRGVWPACRCPAAREPDQLGPNKPLAAVEPGDLVQYPGHVMMSLGLGTAIVHAPQTGKTVEVKAWSKARRAGSPLG